MKKKKPAVLRTAIYIRVSTDAQAKTGDSIGEQMETLQDFINKSDLHVLHDVYIDDGISGQKLNRGDFARLIDDVKAGRVDFIIFTKLDRWFRSLRHYLNTQAILEANGCSWLAVSQPYFDTSTPHGRAFVAQSMTFAELEAQNDSARILDVFNYKYKRGEVLSGNAPFGYKIENKHLVPNERAGDVLRVFEYFKACGSLTQTVAFMENDLNYIITNQGLKRCILTNKKYIGVFRDNNEYCPPLVPVDLFDDVQRLLTHNVRCNSKYDYVFSGLIKCACCGYTATGAPIRTTRKNGVTYIYPAYRCRQAFPNKRCKNRKYVNERTLEKYLLDRVQPLLNDYIVEYELKTAPAVDYTAKRAALLHKIDKLKELYINDLITLDDFKTDKQQLLQQINDLPTQAPPPRDLEPLHQFLKMDLRAIYETLEPAERRRLWRSVIKEIRVDENHKKEVIFL